MKKLLVLICLLALLAGCASMTEGDMGVKLGKPAPAQSPDTVPGDTQTPYETGSSTPGDKSMGVSSTWRF